VANRPLLPYLWMLCGCFSFAWMTDLASALGRERDCDWRLVALARSSLAFVFAAALARLTGAPLVLWRPRVLWMRSLAGSVSLLCTFYALTRLRSTEVLTLTNTFPIWVALLSWPLFRERPSLGVWLAAACGVAGIALIQQPHFDEGNLAIPLALTAAFTSALAMLGLHRIQGVDAWAIVAHFSAVATLFVLAACFVGEPPELAPLRAAWNLPRLLGVGATATAGQLCLTRAFSAGPPAKVSVIGLTQIVFVLVLDVASGGPWLNPLTLCGIGLVVAPTAWVMVGKGAE
jgi:drug/metabolite transporter (DMT)-like permease